MEDGCCSKEAGAKPGTGGSRGARTLPFSKETFRLITRNFHTHGSIARAVSRADVAMFSQDRIRMTEQAYGKAEKLSHELLTNFALTLTSL